MHHRQETDDAPPSPDDVIVNWCRGGDWYFHHEAPLHPPRDKRREEKEYEILDPLIGPNGESYVGTHNIRQSWAALKLNGYQFLAGILEVLCTESTFVRDCVPTEEVTPAAIGRRDTMNHKNIAELNSIRYLVDIGPPNLTGKELRKHLEKYGQVRFASLFTRAKANATKRLLLNGRPGNAALNSPPYFMFFSPETIVRILIGLEAFRWGLDWPYRRDREGGGECVGGDVVRFGSVRLSLVRELISHWSDIEMLPFGTASQHQTYSTRMEYRSIETFISERAHFIVNQSQEELTDSTRRFPGLIGFGVCDAP